MTGKVKLCLGNPGKYGFKENRVFQELVCKKEIDIESIQKGPVSQILLEERTSGVNKISTHITVVTGT